MRDHVLQILKVTGNTGLSQSRAFPAKPHYECVNILHSQYKWAQMSLFVAAVEQLSITFVLLGHEKCAC